MPTRTRPIRQLLVALVLIMQLPALAAFGALLVSHYQAQREEVIEEMVERARAIAVSVRETQQAVERALNGLAAEAPRDDAGLAQFHERLRQEVREGRFDSAALVTPDGRQVLNTRVTFGEPLPRVGPGAMRPFTTGRLTVIDLATSSITGRPVTGLGIPVVSGNRIVYSLDATLEATRFRDLLQAQKLPEGWILAIIDNQGRVVARVPEHDDYVGRSVTADLQERIGRPIPANYEVFESRTLSGIDVVTAMRRSPVNGWSALVSVPRTQLYAPIWKTGGWLAAGFMLLLGASLWAATLVSLRITSSIAKLREAAALLPARNGLVIGELGFAEARDLGATLQRAATDITSARKEVDRVTVGFQRTLLAEIETRQIQIARELHDSVGSSLAGVQLLLSSARHSVTGPRAAPLVEKALEEVTAAARHVREISRGMMPAGSERGGLRAAIEQFAADLSDLKGVRCTLRTRGDFSAIEAEAATHLYRIVQEATTNAIRHGQCTALRITLARAGRYLRLSIADNGMGCDAEQISATHPGMGLRSMQARARAIDAQLEFGSPPGGGCRVRVTWALAA